RRRPRPVVVAAAARRAAADGETVARPRLHPAEQPRRRRPDAGRLAAPRTDPAARLQLGRSRRLPSPPRPAEGARPGHARPLRSGQAPLAALRRAAPPAALLPRSAAGGAAERPDREGPARRGTDVRRRGPLRAAAAAVAPRDPVGPGP